MTLSPFELPIDEGPDKVTSLKDAVRNLVRPGMVLHFGFAHSRANAVAFEIIRQYRGETPDFTLVGAGMLDYAVAMVGAGLVKKMVAGFFGDTFPSPAPSAVLQRAYRSGEVTFECWTNLTVSLGLLAGALNVPFMPTTSLLGSSLLVENASSMRKIADPFGGGEVAAVQALKPDLAIVHGLAADRSGNAIVGPPYGEGLWGAFAAREGVLVTVEELVTTETIRKHSSFVKIPGHIVRSVCRVPFGAHPQGMSNFGLAGSFEGYAEDYEFREEFRRAAKTTESFRSWLEEWVLGGEHEDYLRKLGRERLASLKGKAEQHSWQLQALDRKAESHGGALPSEAMVVAAAHLINAEAKKHGCKAVLAGIGASHLAAWLAKYLGGGFELLTETGFYGYWPRPGDAYIFNFPNIYTCKMQSDFIQILGAMVPLRAGPALGVLSAAEIDKDGNLNSTKKPGERTFLVGGGGSNDVASNAAEVIVLARHCKDRLVERVSYVTCPGTRVRHLVTDKALFEKDEAGRFVLVACLGDASARSLAARIAEAKANCGWEFPVAENVTELPLPSANELELVRLLDPGGCLSR